MVQKKELTELQPMTEYQHRTKEALIEVGVIICVVELEVELV